MTPGAHCAVMERLVEDRYALVWMKTGPRSCPNMVYRPARTEPPSNRIPIGTTLAIVRNRARLIAFYCPLRVVYSTAWLDVTYIRVPVSGTPV